MPSNLSWDDEDNILDTPPATPIFSHIQGNLWMGGTPAHPSKPALDAFQYIICLYPWEPYELDDHHVFIQAKLFDHGIIPDRGLLYSLATFVNYARLYGNVLVHCQQGWNRSGLVTALSLILGGDRPEDAIALLRKQRCPEVLCNKVFELWLMTLKPGGGSYV